MPSEPQNLSREMILPAYKAAISPGSPLSHTTPANSANRLNPQESDCPESENVRRITYEFISKLCKTNPILSASGGFKTLYLAKAYENQGPPAGPKNEPKRTQTKPNFPKNRKSTQPQFSQKVTTMKPPSPSKKQTQTNPIKPNSKPPTYSLTRFRSKTLQTCPSLQISARPRGPKPDTLALPSSLDITLHIFSRRVLHNYIVLSLKNPSPLLGKNPRTPECSSQISCRAARETRRFLESSLRTWPIVTAPERCGKMLRKDSNRPMFRKRPKKNLHIEVPIFEVRWYPNSTSCSPRPNHRTGPHQVPPLMVRKAEWRR